MKTSSTTRRQFLAASAALPFALRSFAEAPVAPRWVFLGTGRGAGIYRAAWNAKTGELGKVELAAAAVSPDFFAMHPKLPVMYSAIEGSGAAAQVAGYRVDAEAGSLTLLNSVSSHGDSPCYVSVDHTGQNVFVADYMGGTVGVYGLGPDGALRDDTNVFDCRKNPVCGELGPVTDRQEAAHMHCTTISPKNDFLLVCNLGEDAIEVFPITPGATKPLGTPIHIPCRTGSGPRHVAFHPNGRWVYCIHELDATIDVYDWKVAGGNAKMTLRAGSTVSLLKPGTPITGNSGCEVVVSDNGRYVYTCVRGTNEIVVYRVGTGDGLLVEQQRLNCGGLVPRYFAFDPTRRWLVCCNQGGAGNVTVFAHDLATGKIAEQPKTFEVNTAMFVAWV